jgi:hypothetical protein
MGNNVTVEKPEAGIRRGEDQVVPLAGSDQDRILLLRHLQKTPVSVRDDEGLAM